MSFSYNFLSFSFCLLTEWRRRRWTTRPATWPTTSGRRSGKAPFTCHLRNPRVSKSIFTNTKIQSSFSFPPNWVCTYNRTVGDTLEKQEIRFFCFFPKLLKRTHTQENVDFLLFLFGLLEKKIRKKRSSESNSCGRTRLQSVTLCQSSLKFGKEKKKKKCLMQCVFTWKWNWLTPSSASCNHWDTNTHSGTAHTQSLRHN